MGAKGVSNKLPNREKGSFVEKVISDPDFKGYIGGC